MSNEIAVKGPNLPAANDFWGEMETSDFAIPTVLVGQPTSSKGKMGEFNYNNGHSTPFLNSVSLLVPSKTRRFFAGKGKPTRCGSSNFHTPSEKYNPPVSTNCMTCPAAAWDTSDEKTRIALDAGVKADERPLCDQTYSLMLVDENGSPFFMDFRGSSLKLIQEKLFSRLRLQFGGVPPYAIQFDMGLRRLDAKKGVYYEVTFENFKASDATRAQIVGGLYQTYSKRAANIREEQVEKMDQETVSQAQPPWPTDDDASDQVPF